MNETIKEFDDAIDDIFNNGIDIEKYQKLKQLFLAKLKEEYQKGYNKGVFDVHEKALISIKEERTKIGKEFVEWFYSEDELVEDAIERITGVKCEKSKTNLNNI